LETVYISTQKKKKSHYYFHPVKNLVIIVYNTENLGDIPDTCAAHRLNTSDGCCVSNEPEGCTVMV